MSTVTKRENKERENPARKTGQTSAPATSERNGSHWESEAWLLPTVDIFETNDGYVLEADMPGVAKDGLEITLDNNVLTLVGRRTPRQIPGNNVYQESQPAHFRRVFELDPSIDSNKINARLDNGILTLHLPKMEKVKPRKISVTD